MPKFPLKVGEREREREREKEREMMKFASCANSLHARWRRRKTFVRQETGTGFQAKKFGGGALICNFKHGMKMDEPKMSTWPSPNKKKNKNSSSLRVPRPL